MKKRMIALFLACILSASLLTGCTTKADKKAQEYKELGISQMEDGDYEAAAQSFQKALNQSTGTIGAEELDLCYYKALALFESGDAEGALETYTALIDYDADNWEVYYLRGRVYLDQGQSEEALADFAKAASLNADDVELCVRIYEDLSDVGLAESGQTYYDKVMGIQPSSAEEYYFVGDLYFLTGDYENAKTNLETANEKGYDKALLMLGQIYASEGDSESAKTAFTTYMEKYPDDAEALNELGEIALSAGEYAEAVTYLESALTASDGSIDEKIEKNLISAYEYSGDFESAYHMAKTFLKSYIDEDVEREYAFLETREAGLNDTEGVKETEDDSEQDADSTDDTDETDEASDSSDDTDDDSDSSDEADDDSDSSDNSDEDDSDSQDGE